MHSLNSSSTQSIIARRGDETIEHYLPPPEQRVVGHRIAWGRVEELGSPAYWSAQAWLWEFDQPDHYRLGRSLQEEVLACLLGGYGIPAEVGLAAYKRLRALPSDDLRQADLLREILLKPLEIDGRAIRYRFANQKANYVAAAMRGLEAMPNHLDDLALRNSLLELPGIGMKTASWIVRNWRGSDKVSILDIHIIRASEGLGLFEDGWQVARDYRRMEQAYLAFCDAISARPSILDSVMWMTMRQLPAEVLTTMTSPRTREVEPKRRRKFDRSQLQLV